MRKLILFDIDGTLIKSSRLHHEAFLHAIQRVHGVDFSANSHTHGLTDSIILAGLSREAGIKEAEIESSLSDLLQATSDYYVAHFRKGDSVLLPGVNNLLESLEQNNALLYLLTGNIELIAKTKLNSLDVYRYFKGGGFGSDPHKSRADLVKYAVHKAGFDNHKSSVYLVGDTPRDIRAAQEAGLSHIVAVATGSYTSKELRGCGAEVTLDDFSDKQTALSAFGY